MTCSFCKLIVLTSIAVTAFPAYGQPDWRALPTPLESLPADSTWTTAPQVAWATTPVIQNYSSPRATYGSNTNCSATPWVNSCQPSTNACLAETAYTAARPNNPWFVSAAGLIMGRDEPPRVWTTYETNNNANQLMNTQAVDPDWQGGVELHLGRQFACGAWAIDLAYWTLDDLEAVSSQTHPNPSGVSTPLLFNDLEFALGQPVQDFFDSAEEHRLSRRNQLHNLELNFIDSGPCQQSGRLWTCRKLLGVRFFRFDEDLSLATLDLGGIWGGNGGADEAYLDSSVENNLVGAQLGCFLERQLGCQGRFFVTPKVGVYNNRIDHRFQLRRGDGVLAMPTAASGITDTYPVESSTDVVSFLTEVNLGLSWQPTCHWSFFGGYRVVALTGMGLADIQIPQYIVDIPEIADIDHHGALVLQGAFFGASFSR